VQHDLAVADVMLWCAEAGLRVDNIEHDAMHPGWIWIGAVKP
jgi:hypothetical protein